MLKYKYSSVYTIIILFALIALNQTTYANNTNITIRALSKGAKFIGSSLGGAEIIIKNYTTRQILAQGLTEGGTGNTQLIMKDCHTRGASIADDKTAAFKTAINIEKPTLIEFIARGPMDYSGIANTTSITQWVVPGKHLTGGDGIVLEIAGLAVILLEQPNDKTLPQTNKLILPIKTKVTMMCGCPIMPNGLWDTDTIEVKAIIKHNGKQINTQDLKYAGKASHFNTKLTIDQLGDYEITIYAYDSTNGNTGVNKMEFTVK